MLSPSVTTKINTLWDRFWSGGIANPLSAMEQISYLLFLRRLDARDEDRAEAARFSGEPYASVFEGRDALRWQRWKHLPAEEMLSHVRDHVFPFIKQLGVKAPTSRPGCRTRCS